MDTRNRKFPVLLAGGIVVAVLIWMLSGLGREAGTSSVSPADSAATAAASPQQVRVQDLQAREITRQIVVSGRTEPNRIVQLKAETEGMVSRIDAERGQSVDAGAPVLSLDMRDRQARLAEAAALLEQREAELRALENLRGQQFSTDIQLAEARAQLESARARHENIQLEIRNTRIAAPFDGVLQERSVEIGDFVRVGDSIAELVDLDPLIVVGEINEREVVNLNLGTAGRAALVDGSELTGRVRYVSPVADPSTRSFMIELAVPNPDAAVRAGLTAEIRLDANIIRVHTLSAALLSLADDGTVGVKVVDDDNRVRFHPVEIAGSSAEGMYVSGLPDSIRIITVGQGFVTEGQRVEPVVVPAAASAATYERTD